jgi:hypothetical protein
LKMYESFVECDLIQSTDCYYICCGIPLWNRQMSSDSYKTLGWWNCVTRISLANLNFK